MTPYMIFFLLFTILPVVLSIVLGFTYYNMIGPLAFDWLVQLYPAFPGR